VVPIAYHFELPVIVTSVGGLAEVVRDGETGFVVAPNCVDALVEAIKKFYDLQHTIDFKAHLRAERQKYSWQAFVEAFEQLIVQLEK
jgi:glycosyltransferase involved in cell wall biosynthesis